MYATTLCRRWRTADRGVTGEHPRDPGPQHTQTRDDGRVRKIRHKQRRIYQVGRTHACAHTRTLNAQCSYTWPMTCLGSYKGEAKGQGRSKARGDQRVGQRAGEVKE